MNSLRESMKSPKLFSLILPRANCEILKEITKILQEINEILWEINAILKEISAILKDNNILLEEISKKSLRTSSKSLRKSAKSIRIEMDFHLDPPPSDIMRNGSHGIDGMGVDPTASMESR